jgi:hypothetical protein
MSDDGEELLIVSMRWFWLLVLVDVVILDASDALIVSRDNLAKSGSAGGDACLRRVVFNVAFQSHSAYFK